MKIYVVGTDGSETAAVAAKRAGELARATGAVRPRRVRLLGAGGANDQRRLRLSSWSPA